MGHKYEYVNGNLVMKRTEGNDKNGNIPPVFDWLVLLICAVSLGSGIGLIIINLFK